MPRKADPVETLAKVLREAEVQCGWARRTSWGKLWKGLKDQYRAMARAAIAHLSKRGAKRGK